MTKRYVCLNKAATKRFILKKIEAMRPWLNIKHVSSRTLDILEAQVRETIIKAIKTHPSKGKTFEL